LDDDNKEHTIEILKEIKKDSPATTAASAHLDNRPPITTQADNSPAAQASLAIDSTPPAADIEIDGAFVGNTPSTVTVASGSHQIAVKKKGFAVWSRTLTVTGGTVHLNAELERIAAQ
jgi:hypothetical protein